MTSRTLTPGHAEANAKIRHARVTPGASVTDAIKERQDMTTNMLAKELEPISEAKLQGTVNAFLKTAPVRCVWFPVPNATGNMGKRRGGILKAGGVRKAGVADWGFAWGAGSGFIELKVGDGKQGQDQIDFEADCESHGVRYEIARSVDDVQAILKSWGVLTSVSCGPSEGEKS